MQNFDQKCVICGIDLDGQDQTFHFGSNTSSQDLNISPSWKKDCATSLCQVLFQFDENVCLPYFQNGDYCSQCLQIMRDVDFNWKQLLKCKRQIKRSSRRICELMKTNFNCIGEILPGEPDSTQSVSGVNQRYRKEVVQGIQLVVSRQSKYSEKRNSISETYQENATRIKEENLDWEAEFEESSVLNEFHNSDTDEYINSGRVSEKPQSKEIGEQIELIETIETELTYEDLVNIFRNTKACNEQFSQCFTKIESDLQAKLSENQKKSLKNVIGGIKCSYLAKWKKRKTSWEKFKNVEKNWLNAKVKVKVDPIEVPPEIKRKPWIIKNETQKFRNTAHLTANRDEDSADKYESQLSDDSDWQLPPQKEIGITNFTTTKLKQKITDHGKERKPRSKIKNENLKSGTYGNTIHSIDAPLILECSERAILKHICAIKVIKLKRLNDSEMALTTKIARYTKKAICQSNLSKKEKNAAFLLKRKLCKRFHSQQKNPKKEIFKHQCKEENCDAKYAVEEKLEGHIRGFHLGESLPHYCTSCPSKFADYDRMKSHRINVHQGVKLSHYYFCDICHKGYKTQEELKTHSESAHRGPNPFACAFCETECCTSGLLIRHTNESHSGISPQQLEAIKKLTCEKCGRYCASQRGLRAHYLLKHNEMKKSFSCEQCDKTFPSKQTLDYHTDRVHSKVICEECGKSYSKSNLSTHQLRHSRILKYKCKICGKQYISSQQLRDHERVHSGVRAFVCRVCGKRFLTRTVLSGHEKTHEPGYIPRKPIRRNRQNRKKKQEHSEQLLQSAVAASHISSGRNNEHPSMAAQNTILNNSQGSQWTPFLISQRNAFVNQM